MRLIPRNSYMEKIINVIGTPDIKVITGVRRCGKSKLLESFKKYIDENIQDANIIHINFNLPEFEELLTFRALYEHINSLYKENMQNFVLIDEVQMCEDYEKAIKSRLNAPKIKGARAECACYLSCDIGAYNTCKHLCRYCYANAEPSVVLAQSRLHDPKSPFLIGTYRDDDIIHDVPQKSWIDGQMSLAI